MDGVDIATADKAFAATQANPRENYVSFFLIGIILAMILAPIVLPVGIESPQGRILVIGPSVLFAALIMISWRRARRYRRCAAAISNAWDSAQLDDWTRVETVLPDLLARPIRSPSDRGRIFVLFAATAERKKCYETAAHVYERLLRERIGDAPLLQQAQLALASAKLRNEELTDAVQLLDRLHAIEMPAPLRAIYEAIRLHQQVFMGHNADAVAGVEERISLFRRHLSTRAGYAYALLAAALHRLGRHDRAQQFWIDATTMVAPADILERYEIARDVSLAYTAAERPL